MNVVFRVPNELKNVFLILCLGIFLAASDHSYADPEPGHSHQGAAFDQGPRQFAKIMPGTSALSFEVSHCSGEASTFIGQGIGQLHGFQNFESERSFRQAAFLDKDCAMAYWGMAMANAVWVRNFDRAVSLIVSARQRLTADHSRRENLYIASVEALARPNGIVEYAKILRTIMEENPDDLEAKAFYVITVWHNNLNQMMGYQGGDYKAKTLPIYRIAQDVLRVNPKHPIHHYVIHMWDNPDDYSLALPSADHSGFTEVGIAHLWHMAGHIYGHAKLPFEQWWSQEAAARVDHTYMRDMRVFPSWIHNHAHNNEWLSRTLMGIGSFEKARGFAYNMLAQPRHPKFNRLDQYMHLQNGIDRTLELIERGEYWDEGLKLFQSEFLACDRLKSRSSSYLMCLRVAGLTELFTGVKLSGGWSISREAVSQQVNTELEAVRSILAGDNPVRPLIRLKALEHLSSGWGLFQLTKYALLAKQGSDALEFARRLVKQDPRNVPFLTLAAFAEAAAGSVDVAQKAVDRLKALSQEVDDSSPFSVRMIAELRNQGLLIQGEWREPFEAWRKIHESRPSLPTLGPLLSTPQHMDDFAWVDDKGKHFQFSKITSGRPAVVALLLGDCPHCDAQFGLLEGQRDKLKEKGIDLVSVFSLPENLPVYRKNWAFDEFESIPLHGLFIVNAQREVVWQDVSADAFLDIEFLMAEVDRALSPLQTKLMHGRPL